MHNSHLTRQGHGQEVAEADLGCMTECSWVAPGVLLRSMEARSGNFTGLFHPSLPPTPTHTPAPGTEPPHTAVTRETLVLFIQRTISNLGQVYFWGILVACPKEPP